MTDLLEAATEAVKDSVGSYGQPPYRAVDPDNATAVLCRSRDVQPEDAARACREALDNLGGHVERIVFEGGLAAGRPPRRRVRVVWWVPDRR